MLRRGYSPRILLREDYQFSFTEQPSISAPAMPTLREPMSRDDIKLLLPEVLNRNILTLAEEERIGRNLVDVIRINSDAQTFLKEYGMQAGEFGERAEPPIGRTRYEKFTMTTKKVGIQVDLSREMIEDCQFDILRRVVNQATLAMSRYEDMVIMGALYTGVPDGSGIVGTNEADHSFDGSGGLTWDLFVQALTAIEREYLRPNRMLLHPYQMAEFLMFKDFRDATNGYWTVYPGLAEGFHQGGNVRGAIGEFMGMEIYVSNNATAGTILILDRDNYAVFGERRPLLVESEEDIVIQAQKTVMSQRYGIAILNNDGAANITGLSTTMPTGP